MKFHMIIGKREDLYEGENAPELLDAWDEYSVAENHEGYTEKLRSLEDSDGFEAVRVLIVKVPDEAVDKIFETPIVEGTVA